MDSNRQDPGRRLIGSAEPAQADPSSKRVLQTAALFAGHKELIIEHAGSHYRLRITQQNKLILTK